MADSTYGPRTAAWSALSRCAQKLTEQPIASLFDFTPSRFELFSCDAENLVLDFSRQRLDSDVLEQLLALAEQTEVRPWIERMFNGFPVNNTEDRPALHTALRRPANRPVVVEGQDVMPAVEAERQKVLRLAESLHAGELKGVTGKAITDVVNIGIGGSDLGVVLGVQALAEYRLAGLGVHFISNIDGVALAQLLAKVDPQTTMFVICSKTFTTLETLTNANIARAWLFAFGGHPAVAAQCVAVSTNRSAMDAFGIANDKRFAIWDWVGGRFSVWSAVGLVIALAIGPRNFCALLQGAHAMDSHFESAPFDQNLPVLLALIGVWNRNFLGISSHALLPYDEHLARFPAYLQQLEMESNGKSVQRDGQPVECATAPVIWGELGSNAQHSFFQLLHQGTEIVSTDFLLPAKSLVDRQAQQDLAAANCLAQVWALAAGDSSLGNEASPGPHQRYAGNRPSSLILFEQLDPATLGKLIALYEHKVFAQGVVWNVNSFDQWGVELGKRLASEIANEASGHDSPLIIGAASRLRELRD